MNNQRNGFLTFVLALIPGVGHLYLGQMNRGLQFLLLFFGSFFIFDLLRLNVMPFVVPVIWFYALFDALHQYRMMQEDGEVEDEPLFSWGKIGNNRAWSGWLLVGIGGYLLLDRLWGMIPWHQITFLPFGNDLLRHVLIAFLLIYVGIRILSGKPILPGTKQNKEDVPCANGESDQ